MNPTSKGDFSLSATHLRRHREDSIGSGATSPESTSPEPMEPPIAIPVGKLHPHPGNPRLNPRQDVIDQICSCLSEEGFHPSHALIVRLYPGGADYYQILSGHHRHAAAVAAGLEAVPCWVRDLDDEAAYMLLMTSNAQGELTALERGMHALHSKLDVKAYAKSARRARQTIDNEVRAARVAEAVPDIGHATRFSELIEIHVAPKWLWPSLVAAMAAEKWTVARTREHVERLKGLPDECRGGLTRSLSRDWSPELFRSAMSAGARRVSRKPSRKLFVYRKRLLSCRDWRLRQEMMFLLNSGKEFALSEAYQEELHSRHQTILHRMRM
jgi:ParB/RepB/Spo0J family partition protein